MAFVALPGAKVVQAAPVVIELNLVGSQENPPVTGPGSAFARLTFDEATKRLDYSMTVSGITADEVTAAHIHRGAVGVNGPVVHNLSTVGFTTIGGTITLSDADVADLKAGNLYLNAHSKTNPGGFARAQVNLTPEAALRASIEATIAAWNRKDIAAFLNGFTANGIMDEFDASPAELAQFLPEFIGDPPIGLRSLTNVQSLSPTRASATIELSFGAVLERSMDVFALEGGVWKIDSSTDLSVPIPSGVTTVPVRMQEFAFVFDKSAVASGNFAFAATNVGRQPHELALARIPANVALQELLQSEDEDIPGFEFIGGIFAEPGETMNMVFTQPLTPGRYAMVCFIEDEATGTPHAFLGMATEFNVGGGGGGTVRPPSTGDGGLAGESSSRNALLAGGILSLLAGGAVALTARRVRVRA